MYGAAIVMDFVRSFAVQGYYNRGGAGYAEELHGKNCRNFCDTGGVVGADPTAADTYEVGLEDPDPRRKRRGLSVAAEPAFGVDGDLFSHQSGHRSRFRRPGGAGDRPACHGADVFVGLIGIYRAVCPVGEGLDPPSTYRRSRCI